MKTSKPFSFILWGDESGFDSRLALYLMERVKVLQNFDYLHYIVHKPEEEAPSVLKRLPPKSKKYHAHCILHFNASVDYDLIVRGFVTLWASTNPGFGECPYTTNTEFEGKCNNTSSFFAYVLHDPRYMRYLEEKCKKPETHKIEYAPDDIQSTDDEKLENELQKAYAFIFEKVRVMQSFEDARSAGDSADTLRQALMECRNESQMRVAMMAHRARMLEG